MRTPGTWTVDDLFRGRPDELALFRAVERAVATIGPAALDVAKTQAAFRTRRAFAWVWPPAVASSRRPKTYVVLSFGLDRRIGDGRVVSAVEPRPGRWTHHVVIEREEDLDAAILSWLAEAYAFGGRADPGVRPRRSGR